MRCLSEFQQVYRDVAARHDCILIDTQSYFHAIGRHGLLDDELFQDAMHPSLRGQIALAQAVLQALRARRAFGWPKEGPIPVIEPAECVAHFRLDSAAWRIMCLWGIKFNSLSAPLTYDPTRRLQARLAYAVAADRIAAGDAPESLGLPNIGMPAPVPAIPPKGPVNELPRPGNSHRRTHVDPIQIIAFLSYLFMCLKLVCDG